MIPFVIKVRPKLIWIWQDSEIFNIECRLHTISESKKEGKYWDYYNTQLLVFLQEPLKDDYKANRRWRLLA